MKTRLFTPLSLILAVALLASSGHVAASQPQGGAVLHLPLIFRAFDCPATSGNSYSQGLAFRADPDNPPRPAYLHADKNLELRSYAIDNSVPYPDRQIQALYPDDDPSAPYLSSMFSPARVPTVLNAYDVYDWIWGISPDPGTRSSSFVSTAWPFTVAGLQVTQGEVIHTPTSGYDLGVGVAAIVLYAASNRITIHYTRDDTVGSGYSIHIEDLCVDPNLLALYNTLENAGRYTQTSYDLVTLTPLQPIGTAQSSELRIVIRDSGGFMDPRSYTEWWEAP